MDNKLKVESSSPPRLFKNLVFQELANIGKSLSDSVRLEILDITIQSPKSVERIASDTNQSIATTSHHLHVLKQSGLVDSLKSGRYVIYSATQMGKTIFSCLNEEAEKYTAKIQKAMKDFFAEPLEIVSPELLLKRVKTGEVSLIDVRPLDEFESGHIQGAISIPLPEIEERLNEIPKKKEIYAYCRGRFCVLSNEAVKILRKKGFKVNRFELGPNDLIEKGFNIKYIQTKKSKEKI